MQVWVVTGGTHGIGKSLCELLRKKDHKVVTCSRNYGDDDCLQADISSPVSAKYVIEHTIKKYGRIDVLVNNAGIYERSTVEDTSIQFWNDCINTNLNGTFYMCRQVIPHMKHRNFGVIMNIASYTAKFLPPERAAYNCSKLAVLGLTATLREELKGYNIIARAYSPWKTATRMDVDKTAKLQPDEVAEQIYNLSWYDGPGDFYVGEEVFEWRPDPVS
ncbi:MAG: SDR family oxidoreductase [Candidatus Kariarchaeaceae archaeon]